MSSCQPPPGERLVALELDCLASSHPIEVPDGVQQPGQIDEIFDAISYRWRLGPASI